MISRWLHTKGVILCLFAGIGILVYINSFSNLFQYDDQVTVEYNREIRTLRNIPYFFAKPKLLTAIILPQEAGHYRPLVITSYAINYALGGLNPVGYHLVNLAFHVGSAFLVFLILKAMFTPTLSLPPQGGGKKGGGTSSSATCTALAAGLIFLVHPFNAEAVNYITARSSLMSGFFYFLGFYCWVRFRGQASGNYSSAVFYIASLLAYAAGMLSKEVVITLPIVLWLYDLYFVESSALRTLLNWRACIAYLPFVFTVVVPYLSIRRTSFGRVLPHFSRDMGTQIFTELPILIKHLQMFLIPTPLTIFHPVEIYKTLWSFPVVFSALILLIFITIAIFLFRISSHPWRVVSFFILWFFIVLLPVTIIPLNALFQENRGYLAVMSFAVFAGMAIGEIQRRKVWWWAVSVLTVLLSVYSVVTFHRNKVWKDELSLWSDAVKKAPLSPEVYTALGIAYRSAGLYPQAIEASEKALLLGGQGNFFAHENLGMVHMAGERWAMAAQELEKAIQGDTYKAQSHFNLGIVYEKMDRPDLAEREYKEAVRLDQDYYRPYVNLGILYTREGRVGEAIQAYRMALSISPGHLLSQFFLGTLLEGAGKKEEAVRYYRKIVEHGGEVEKAVVQEARRRLEKIGQ